MIPSREHVVEISADNFDNLLQDEGFVDFFNTFLALPCFAERLFYNRENDVFEEFTQTLAEDKGKEDSKSSIQLRPFSDYKGSTYNSSATRSEIGYYVTIIKKPEALEFVKKHRLPLFSRSELFAEYKLSKHLSAVQDSFFRELPPDEDDDVGVEEPAGLFSQTRSRSGVSFDLSPSIEDRQSSTDEAEASESQSEDHCYLPTHVRSIEETFDAWQQSFTGLPGSLASVFSSRASSPNQQMLEEEEKEEDEEVGEKEEEDEEVDVQLSSTEFSAQETDVAVSHTRPTSRISILSDLSTPQRRLNTGIKSRASSANTVSFREDTIDQIGSDNAEKFNAEATADKSDKSIGAAEMTRSLSSAVSFISEHGQIPRNSLLLEYVCDKPSNDYSKQNTPGQTEQMDSDSAGKKEDELQSKSTESKQTISSTSTSMKMCEYKSETSTGNETDGNSSPSQKNVISTCDQLNEDQGISNGEKQINDKDDEGAISCNVQTVFTDGGKEQNKAGPGSNQLCTVENDLIDKEYKDRISAISVENDGTHTGTQENFSIEKTQFYIGVERLSGETEAEEQLTNGLSGEIQCLCSDRQSKSPDCSVGGPVTLLESREPIPLLSNSENAEPVFCGYNELKNAESEETLSGRSLEEIERPHFHTHTLENSLSMLTENNQEGKEGGRSTEIEPSNFQDEQEELASNGAHGRVASQENSILGEFQDESMGKKQDDEVEDEGACFTEASGPTLQGLRGVFGPKLTRCSTAATSTGFDLDDESAFSEDGIDAKQKPSDLATKEAFDAFKEFLLDTSGEKLLQFWLEVESGRFLDDEDERSKMVQGMRDRFFKNSGIYEFSAATKERLNIVDGSKITYESLFAMQPDVLEPLLSYWCVRFTMHQQRRSHFNDLEYSRLIKDRSKWCVKREDTLSNLPQVPGLSGLTQVLPKKPVTRPLSSAVNRNIQHQTSRLQVRAKSAHPRLLHSHKCVHTNVSTQQLESIVSPIKIGYGFDQPPGPSFPVEPKPDYLPSVRLFINPVPSSDSKTQRMVSTLHRTTVFTGSAYSSTTGSDHDADNSNESLDSLIQGLIYERQTGNYFQVFLQTSGNKTWMNCLAFWKSLQEYNAYFFADSLNPSLLSRKAQSIYANFVVPGSGQDVHVNSIVQEQVRKELYPPYEELFDAVEEHVLYSLLEPWNILVSQERDEYTSKVPKEQILRHIEIKLMDRRRHSIGHSSSAGLGDTEDEQDKERISVDEANRAMPEPKDGFTFETLIKNREEVEHFKNFLTKKHGRGIKDLMAWTDMETFRRLPQTMEEKRDKKAREIRDNWLGKKYFFGSDSPATREGRNLIMNLNGGRPIKERPRTPVILESQKFARARIERRWLMLFKQTTEFLERQKPHVASVPEMVEDIMLKRRLQRSEAAWKILNSRWVSSSRDVVALRQTLLHPESCSEFIAYVAMKGDILESNIQFWLEVQKFKDLCHSHAQPALIHRKVQTIIDCFLNSALSPELQIDIPIEMAEKLIEKLSGRTPSLHPYVFREAQMTVFRVLFNHWKEFVTQRSRIPAGVNPRDHFAELLRRHRADAKSKKEASERRRLARLSAERRKKEKEEREKRRMEDLTSLFSAESASLFYVEEDDTRSWFYSKYLVEQERQQHIKRLKEEGILVPQEELVDDKEEAKSRQSCVSIAKSSTLSKRGHDAFSDQKSSEGSSKKQHTKLLKRSLGDQLSPSTARRGSAISSSLSLPRRHSGESLAVTRKDDKMSTTGKVATSIEKRDECNLKNAQVDIKNERKIAEIQVFPLVSPETLENDQGRKLLAQRSRSRKQLLPSAQATKITNVKKLVPLDAISCISDYSNMNNVEFSPRKTAAEKTGHQDGTSPLTFKSLKDFTNSPEGAQLPTPLPLVRITSASHQGKSDADGSVGERAPFQGKTQSLAQVLGKKMPIRQGTRKRLSHTKDEMQILPDVIVN